MPQGDMGQDFFRIGMRVNIEINVDEGRKNYPSKIEDFQGEDLILSMPMKGRNPVPIGTGEIINIFFLKDHVFYCLRGQVVKSIYEPVPLIQVKPIDFVYKNQRNFFRLMVTEPVEVSLENNEEIRGFFRDLSAGGALLVLPRELKPGTLVSFKVPVLTESIEVTAKVVRHERDGHRDVNPHYVAVEFVNISEADRDEIIKYLLEEQRILRKRGLL